MGIYTSKYTGQEIDNGINPVGTIISFMGLVAPDGYLICDGSELNIADYGNLATHFETQFGTKNHFGGDGTTTFALPDLRNEFLRGYHGEASEQLSGDVGIHQDATSHVNIYQMGDTSDICVFKTQNLSGSAFNAQAYNIDSVSAEAKHFTSAAKGSTGTPASGRAAYYTSRPTNVAVLYCIKF